MSGRHGDVVCRQACQLGSDALLLGDASLARHFGEMLLARALERGDAHYGAHAELILSRSDILDSRCNEAMARGLRAADAFADHSDNESMARALTVVTFAASVMALPGVGAQAAELVGQARAPLRESAAREAETFNYLGVASLWAGDFKAAAGHLETSAWFGNDAAEQGLGFQPLVNACLVEVLQLAKRELQYGEGPDLTYLFVLIGQCRRLLAQGAIRALGVGDVEHTLMILDFTSCYAHIKRQDLDRAVDYLVAMLERVNNLPARAWVRGLTFWARVELALARLDGDQAYLCAYAMARTVVQSEHRALLGVARRYFEFLRSDRYLLASKRGLAGLSSAP